MERICRHWTLQLSSFRSQFWEEGYLVLPHLSFWGIIQHKLLCLSLAVSTTGSGFIQLCCIFQCLFLASLLFLLSLWICLLNKYLCHLTKSMFFKYCIYNSILLISCVLFFFLIGLTRNVKFAFFKIMNLWLCWSCLIPAHLFYLFSLDLLCCSNLLKETLSSIFSLSYF